MAATFVEKSAFLAVPALSSLDQARSISTTVSLPAIQAKQQRRSLVAVAAFNRRDLESKSIVQLRAIARQRGISASTKDQIINALTGGSSAPSSYGASISRSAPAAPSGSEAMLLAKPLSELRALAAQKGLRGDTKAELVKLLINAGGASSAPASFSPSSPTFAPMSETPIAAASATNEYERRLQVKPMSKLRAVARMRGVFGTTRAELVKGLLAHHGSGLSVGASVGAAAALHEDRPEIVGQLESLPFSELRALAKERGVRGDNRKELIKQLTNAPQVKAAAPAAPAYTNGSSTTFTSYGPAYTSAVALSSRELATKSMAQLRAIASQRGIRGNTKQELVKALSG